MASRYLKNFFPILFFVAPAFAFAQDSTINDSPAALPDVRITAFEQRGRLRDIPASVGHIGPGTLQRFGMASIVQAVNTIPGLRMEERSPGSYRFNIRGSSIRSPFGVRNVKVYFNDLPITDPGGTTYLNQLGSYSFRSLEVIRGPGSSVYGAGTGGVLLIGSLAGGDRPRLTAEYTFGSYGLHNLYGSFSTGNENSLSQLSFQHQVSGGYRQQSALRRDLFNWSGNFKLGNGQLKSTFLLGDLFYETPGALTFGEFQADPRAARPGGGGFPGAFDAQASIRQRTFLAGASYEQNLFGWLRNKTALYGMFTELTNPNLRAYEKSSIPHAGGRSVFSIQKTIGKSSLGFDAGMEWQEGFSKVSIHKNFGGRADSLRSVDELDNRQQFVFAQGLLDLAQSWSLTAGLSWNWSKLAFSRFAPATIGRQTRRFNNGLAPRLALMKKFVYSSLYTSLSKGFSPPSTAELVPTGGAINLGLEAEKGISYELGFKTSLPSGLTLDAAAFLFRLENTIVQRRDAGGGDYFTNAGKTDQKGIEVSLAYPLLGKAFRGLQSNAWISYTYHRFSYKEFRQLNNDFSGNALPGIAPHTLSAGYDVQTRKGWLATLSYYFSDRVPLSDAGSAYATAYHLLGARLGYQHAMGMHWKLRLTGGVENLLDQLYSLGNDINGFGGRFYNAAPGRNFYISMMIVREK
ncbi:MAG TPA: TonB-dependent receptor [Flavisolibacter sp.]|nr:TonB-dependent receptor [Flavisolibacter sp.]